MFKLLFLMTLVLAVSSFRFSKVIDRRNTRAGLTYPIRMAYIDKSSNWYGDAIAGAWGVPGQAQPHNYTVMALSFWSCGSSSVDMANVWEKAINYFAPGNSYGDTTEEIQIALRKAYNDEGIKVVVSAFGATEFPTTRGYDPVMCGYKLAQFVKNNHFDGADIDWEDNGAMSKGLGEDWLIKFTLAYREASPDTILSHAPQGPYFKSEFYQNGDIKGAYETIHREVGHLIDFYMVQFYNQVETAYDTYDELFINATGPDFNKTAVKQIHERGVPYNKIVVGKPILTSDATNTGWVNLTTLGEWAVRAKTELGWYAGIGHWQYASSKDGSAINACAGPLIDKCDTDQDCV